MLPTLNIMTTGNQHCTKDVPYHFCTLDGRFFVSNNFCHCIVLSYTAACVAVSLDYFYCTELCLICQQQFCIIYFRENVSSVTLSEGQAHSYQISLLQFIICSCRLSHLLALEGTRLVFVLRDDSTPWPCSLNWIVWRCTRKVYLSPCVCGSTSCKCQQTTVGLTVICVSTKFKCLLTAWFGPGLCITDKVMVMY